MKLTRSVSEGERFRTHQILSLLKRSPSLTLRVTLSCGFAAMFHPL